MSRIKRLTQSYSKYVAVPWRSDAAAAQRVIFCVYNETEELRLRAKVDEFEIATRAAGHEWALFDLTDGSLQGRFRIGAGGETTYDTDGIELILGDFGPDYPAGLFIAQDGDNLPDAQNFKLVSWQRVLAALGL